MEFKFTCGIYFFTQATFIVLLAKYKLHQQHIKYSSTADTEQYVLFPSVKEYDKYNRQKFRYSICSASRYIFQTINDQ